MSVECKRSKDFANTLKSFLCQSYIKQGVAFVLGAFVRVRGISFGWDFVRGHLSYLRVTHDRLQFCSVVCTKSRTRNSDQKQTNSES